MHAARVAPARSSIGIPGTHVLALMPHDEVEVDSIGVGETFGQHDHWIAEAYDGWAEVRR